MPATERCLAPWPHAETMIETPRLPKTTACADCGVTVAGRYGWCSLCCEAYCVSCGRRHYCTTVCAQGGCAAGYCVRLVTDGTLSRTWGLPADD